MAVSDPIADFLTAIRNAVRAKHRKLDVPEPLCTPSAQNEARVIGDHQIPGRPVFHLPETHHLALRSRHPDRSSQSIHPLSVLDIPHARLTR